MRIHQVAVGAALVAASLAVPVAGPPMDAGADTAPLLAVAPNVGHGPDGPELDHSPVGPQWEVDLHAPWAASEWDEAEFTADQPDSTALPTVHAVYLHPLDQPSRFQEFAAMLQADARDASKKLADLYGRGIRWDERTGAGGASYVDITVVRSAMTTAELAAPQWQFNAVYSELFRVGLNKPNKKYAVWLDAPSTFCGQAMLSQDRRRRASNGNELTSLAIVYRKGAPVDVDGGFCRGRTLLHELGHAMGALQEGAPNAFDGAHCADSAEDVMCYAPPALNDTGRQEFDYRNDDYWDPAANPALGSSTKLPWWTVNLSRFICPTTGCANANKNPGY